MAMNVKTYKIIIEGEGPCHNGLPYEDADHGARSLAMGLQLRGGTVSRAEIVVNGRAEDVLQAPTDRQIEFAARAHEETKKIMAGDTLEALEDSLEEITARIAELKAKRDAEKTETSGNEDDGLDAIA